MGIRLVFDKEDGVDISALTIKQTGVRIPIDRENMVYNLPLHIDAPEQNFSGQGTSL